MDLFLPLLILLCVSRLFGELADRAKQPPLIGELVAGILLGVLAIQLQTDYFKELGHDESFLALTDLGIFFLMLLGGAELRIGELSKVSGKALFIAMAGMLLPLACGFGFGWAILPDSDYKFAQSLFLGTAMSVTAVPVSIRVFMDLGRLHSPAGQTIVSAAFIDDILSLVVLAILTGILDTGKMPGTIEILGLCGNIVLFFVIVMAIKKFIVPKMRGIVRHFHTDEFSFSSLLIAGFALAVLAELLHLHFIVGAFTAGLFFEKEFTGPKTYAEVKGKVASLTLGFMAPIFFASIGLHLDVTAIGKMPWIVLGLLAIAFFSKIIGAGLTAWKVGHSRKDALAIGVGMSSRGAVELVIADIALRAGLFNHPDPVPPVVSSMFSAIVIMAVTTTVVAPVILKWIYRHDKQGDEPWRGAV